MTANVEKQLSPVPVTPPVASAPTTSVKPEDYNALVASARLREIKLVNSEFSLEPDGLLEPVDWKQSHKCEIQNSYYDEARGMLIAWVNAEATCSKDGNTVVSVRSKYIVLYSVEGNPEHLAVTAFANRVARFSVYPYFRAHFAGVAAQAGLSLPPLPIIKEKKVIPPIEQENQVTHNRDENN